MGSGAIAVKFQEGAGKVLVGSDAELGSLEEEVEEEGDLKTSVAVAVAAVVVVEEEEGEGEGLNASVEEEEEEGEEEGLKASAAAGEEGLKTFVSTQTADRGTVDGPNPSAGLVLGLELGLCSSLELVGHAVKG